MSNVFLSPYDDYKSASCQWLDSVPQNWVECRIKQIVSTPVADGPHETPKFEDDGVPFLSAESVKGLKLDFARKRGFISEELHRQYSKKYVPQRGDIYMVKSGATTGALAIVETDEVFNIWSPLAAIRCRKDLCFDRFVFYAMQSEFFQRSVELSWSFGTQQNIGMGVIENLFVARPPKPEQKQIAAFLDHETSKIDALIEKQQQLIALLGEKRQAVISHAVTKGLNPNAPMRDSGIEWLGEVPEHWTVGKFGRLAFMQEGPGLRTWQFKSNGTRVICVTNITENGINFSLLEKFISKEEYLSAYTHFTVEKGNLLLSSSGNSWGKVARYDGNEAVILNTSTIRVDELLHRPLTSDFIRVFLKSDACREQLGLMMTGACQPNFGPTHLNRVKTPMPPTAEQETISQFIDEQSEKYDGPIRASIAAIELLQERRTALISAAVTGKIDVRGWKPPSSEVKVETEMEVV